MRSAFYYSPLFEQYRLSETHPLRPIRYRRTRDLLEAYGVFGPDTPILEPSPAPIDAIARVHTPAYLDAIQRASEDPTDPKRAAYGLGPGDTPAFRGMWEPCLYYTGATLDAARLVVEGSSRRAHNIAGGLHHAMTNRASGFCILNDAAVAIRWLLDHVDRVAYVDIDAHHGDGVESIFADEPRVMTISMHESGRWLFPGTGHAEETGHGAAHGTIINVPLAPYTLDDSFMETFNAIVPRALDSFRPDVVVGQFGADAHYSDPLTHLGLTSAAYEAMLGTFAALPMPWIALGGGGYNIEATPRIWALVFAATAGLVLPDALPESYQARHGGDRLRDNPVRIEGTDSFDSEGFNRKTIQAVERALRWS